MRRTKSVKVRVMRDLDGVCLYGLYSGDGCYGGLDPHHIVYRSKGGRDEEDNLITLCRKHHDMVHRKEIPISELRKVLETYRVGGRDVGGSRYRSVPSLEEALCPIWDGVCRCSLAQVCTTTNLPGARSSPPTLSY